MISFSSRNYSFKLFNTICDSEFTPGFKVYVREDETVCITQKE